ncbi:methyltransferase-like protein 25 isoform X1 [Diaphorina citri]|uniref:Methyltransferase-like protein 25 isoform X1 n=1 Tax=Diaphorina citri TaxID=121845 RepID=A0A1S4EK62_DIACI|nr:methyltransferase-like protein 25 isoform X1 [Diaphorina citri]
MELIKNTIDEMIEFITPNIACVNTHTVHFMVEKLWETTIPKAILSQVNNSPSFDSLLEEFWKSRQDNHVETNSELVKFFQAADKFRLTSLMNGESIITVDELFSKLQARKCGQVVESAKVSQLMSEKKSYEVQVMSQVVAAVTNSCDSSHIIDLGGGQGYLSTILALQHGKKTLSLDYNQVNTHGAAVRSKKLEKLWMRTQNRQTSHASVEHHGKNWKRKSKAPVVSIKDEELVVCKDKCKQITHFVTPDSDISSILSQAYPQDSLHNVCIMGLHTCGDLSGTALRLFTKSSLQCLVQVGCCYHLLEEEFIRSPFWKDVDQSLYEHGYGFPLSEHLRSRKFFLGRNVRMSGTQSPERVIDLKQTQTLPLFYRALLEKYLRSKITINDEEPKVVGRLATKCSNFVEYVHRAVDKLKLDLEVDDEEVTRLFDSHQREYEYLQIYYFLKTALAPVIEALIVLDRVLYLREQGFSESYVVQIFDPLISPRCYAVVSLKPTPPSPLFIPREDSDKKVT